MQGVSLKQSGQRLTLANGYLQISFDLEHPQIDVLQADFTGAGQYGRNVVAQGMDGLARKGIVLERYDVERDGQAVASYASSQAAHSSLAVTIVQNTADKVVVRINGIVDYAPNPLLTSSWTIALAAGEHFCQLDMSVEALRPGSLASICISSYFSLPSVYGLFERGVMQRMNSATPCFATSNPLHRFYALGGGACVDIEAEGQQESVLLNAARSDTSTFYNAGLQSVLSGSYPVQERWSQEQWGQAQAVQVETSQRWTASLHLGANNYDFPIAYIPSDSQMLFADTRTFATAIYATTVGSLASFELPGKVSPTLATPDRGYSPLYNFFDPDAWETVCALLYSGDSYLQNEARKIIEASGVVISADGQIPHHFHENEPVFEAISGAVQTGPNLFWISAVLQYARITGDEGWLREQMPRIELALKFLTDRYNASMRLINAPGPLWIDVFIRDGYTADTNAFAVGLLREVADAEQFLGQNELAQQRRTLADEISAGMNERLWMGDHYITQMNVDGSRRDLVDYDANLLAVAFGIASSTRAAAILARVDSGPCTHARATYVSERFYGAENCYNGNVGDSSCTMGRIGWADGHARAVVGDIDTLEQRIIEPLRADLFAATWLRERYDCQGVGIRTPYYHEYPEVLVMLLREVVFGIKLGLGTVVLQPIAPTNYHYRVGNVQIDFSPRAVSLTLVGSGQRQFSIHRLLPNTSYRVVAAGLTSQVKTDAKGMAQFAAPAGGRVSLSIL
ncbi:MAG: hypothetical protein H0U76_06470 [Ktedonobacteraceae bacterium]|nr:hypothetical protein [Ktedonobacteraceae bacterium]